MATVSFNTHFPGYDVLGEISRSNARVLKARHVATGDLVAIKHFALNTDHDTLRRFERESEIMTGIAHPNIVKVREIRLDAELPYIVMDFVEGGSVRQLLTQDGCLSVETTIRLGLQMLDAFRTIHPRGIVHRDIKPENILYHELASGELHFLLTDFGIARMHEQPVTVTGQSLMTYEYAAPEQFDNPREVSEAADYYSLGVVLYECLTGNVPFAMRNETGIVTFMNQVLSTPPPAPVLASNRPLPNSLTELLRTMLVKKPVERVHNPDAIKLALKQAELEQLQFDHRPTAMSSAAVTPVDAPRPTQVAPSVSPRPNVNRTAVSQEARPRSGWKRTAVIAGVVGLIGLGVYGWVSTQKEKSITGPAQTTPTANTANPVQTTEQTAEAQRQALLERQERYQEQVLDAGRQLDVETFGAKVGLFGGIKNLGVQLKNPSSVTFLSVRVDVRYIKENGDVFKITKLFFNDVGPGTNMTKRAPDSPRGTRFSARVIKYDAAPFVDSLAAPLTP